MEVPEGDVERDSSPALDRLHPRFRGQARVSEMIRSFWPFTHGRRRLIILQLVLSIGLFGATALVPLQIGHLLTAALSTASADKAAARYVVDPIALQRSTQAVLAPELKTAQERRTAGKGIRAAIDQLRVTEADATLDALFPGDLAYRTNRFPAIEDPNPGWEHEAAAIIGPELVHRSDLDALREQATAAPTYATNRAFNWVVSLLLTDKSAKAQRADWRNQHFRSELIRFAILLLTIFVLRAVTLLLAQRATLASARRLQDAVFERVHDTALVDAGALARPSMVSRCTTYVDRVTTTLLKAQTEGVPAVAALLFSAGFLLLIDVPIGLIMIGVIATFEIVRRLMSTHWSRLAHERLDLNTSLSEIVDGSIANSAGIRSLRAESAERHRFSGRADEVIRHTRRLEAVAEAFRVTAFGFGQFAVLLVIAVVGFVRKDLNLAQATAVVLYVREVSASLQELPGMIVDLQEAAPYMRRLRRVLAAPTRRTEPAHRVVPPTSVPSIELDRVGFRYADESPGCHDVSLVATNERWSVLVGLDASGIHTVVELAAGLEQPDAGTVRFGDVDLASLDQSAIEQLVTVLPAIPSVFEGTVTQNIQWACRNASPESIEQAVRGAGLDAWARSLPKNMDTVIGIPRQHLSNEIRSRIGVARVLLSQAPVVIIDDPTIVLDRELAASIWSTLRNALHGRIVVAATTRIDYLDDDDLIHAFERGRISERGTRQELLHAHGHFARLWSRLIAGNKDSAELCNVPALAHLAPEVLNDLAGRLVTERFEPAEIIFEEDEDADRVFLVVDGVVDLVSAGRRIASVRTGQHFGDLDLGKAATRVTSAVARTAVVTRSLHRLAVSRGLAAAIDRPDDERVLYTWIVRRGSASLPDLDELRGRIDLDLALAGLLADGSITESDPDPDGSPTYRVSRVQRRTARSISLLATLFPES